MKTASKFKIEKGVPLIGFKQKEGHGRTLKYPLKELRIGHSFAIETAHEAKLIRAACWSFKNQYPEYNFTVRHMADGTYRCWRIKVREEV